MTVVNFFIQLLHVPAQRVAIHIEVHRQRTCHQVALHVRNLLHGHIDVGLLHHEIWFFQLNEQLVVLRHIAVLEVLQLSIAVHGRIVVAIHEGLVHSHQRVAALQNLALSIYITLDADACRLQAHLIVVQVLRTTEVEVEHQWFRCCDWRVGRVLEEEVDWQYALKHTHLVDVAGQSILHAFLVVSGTQ